MRPDRSFAVLSTGIIAGIVTILLFAGLAVVASGMPASAHLTAVARPSMRDVAPNPPEGIDSVAASTGVYPVGSIALGSSALAVGYDSRDARIDVLVLSGNLTMVNASNDSVIEQTALPMGYYGWPVAETYDGNDGLVYATTETHGLCTGCGGPYTVAINGPTGAIVATNTSLSGIDVVSYLDCLSFDPQNGVVYACDSGMGRLVLYNGSTDTIVGSMSVGTGPSAATFDPNSSELYVADWGSDDVAVVDTASSTVLTSIPVGSEPDGITFDSANGFLYVANNASDNVSVIDGQSNTVVATIPVGCDPGGLTYDAADGDVYVVNNCSDNLTAISGANNTVVGAVPVGSYPDGIAYDSANERLYVANSGSDNVTVLGTGAAAPEYAVTFTEGGLPAGTEWFVNLTGGASYNSTTNSISFQESNGTLGYVLATSDKQYAAVGGTLTVNGSAVTTDVVFRLVTFTLTFSETGLPSGTDWWVNGSALGSYRSTSGTLEMGEPNGTYLYSVATANKEYAAVGGSLIVVGAAVAKTVTFAPVEFTVTFSESGLPTGTNWSVSLDGVTRFSSLTAIVVDVVNGSYSFTIGNVPGFGANRSTGTLTMKGADAVVPLTFASTSSSATFLGLPAREGYAAAAGIALVAVSVVAMVLVWRRRRRTREDSRRWSGPPHPAAESPRTASEEPGPETR